MTLRLAHRGDHTTRRGRGAQIEDTLAALVAAAQRPDCDGVEFDVRLSADGVPILHHDESLERVHGLPLDAVKHGLWNLWCFPFGDAHAAT